MRHLSLTRFTTAPRGRHSIGAPTSQPARRVWDAEKRAAAHSLDARRPGWTVMYGTYSRLYFAFAAWRGCDRLVIRARTAEELERKMADAELEAARRDPDRPRRAELVRQFVCEGAA